MIKNEDIWNKVSNSGQDTKNGIEMVSDIWRGGLWMPQYGDMRGWTIDDFKRSGGRLKKYWEEVIRYGMTQLQLIDDITLYRSIWRTQYRIWG